MFRVIDYYKRLVSNHFDERRNVCSMERKCKKYLCIYIFFYNFTYINRVMQKLLLITEKK